MSKLIQGIHHVALKCTGQNEFASAKYFYGTVLGLEMVRTWGTEEKSGILFQTGNGLIELFANGDVRLAQGSIRHFALQTTDVDACVAAVRAAGYPVTVEPKEVTIPSQPPYLARVAFCTGPVGEAIEFFQER